MKKMIATVVLMLTMIGAAQAGTYCKDGHYSQSEGSGTCSHHGGER